MKKVLLTFVCALFCLFSFAQNPPTSFTWQTDDLKTIGASDAQISQIIQLTKDSRARIKVIYADASLSDAEKKAKEKQEYVARSEERSKILTPEQMEKVKQITKERRGK